MRADNQRAFFRDWENEFRALNAHEAVFDQQTQIARDGFATEAQLGCKRRLGGRVSDDDLALVGAASFGKGQQFGLQQRACAQRGARSTRGSAAPISPEPVK